MKLLGKLQFFLNIVIGSPHVLPENVSSSFMFIVINVVSDEFVFETKTIKVQI